jgi:apolipoprotein D and lipocalin family protein
MKVVRNLGLERYMGRWYEITCFPSTLQPKTGTNMPATRQAQGPLLRAAFPPRLPHHRRLFGYQYALVGQPSLKYPWVSCSRATFSPNLFVCAYLVQAAADGRDRVCTRRVEAAQDGAPWTVAGERADPRGDGGLWWIKSIFGKYWTAATDAFLLVTTINVL